MACSLWIIWRRTRSGRTSSAFFDFLRITSVFESDFIVEWETLEDVYLTWCEVCVCVHKSKQESVCARVCVCVWCCPRHWKCWGVQRGYFWISDSVSMAADASQRKALRYQQTLVGLFPKLPLPACLSAVLFVSLNIFSLPFSSLHVSRPASPSSLHLPICHLVCSNHPLLFLILSPWPFQTFIPLLSPSHVSPAASFLVHQQCFLTSSVLVTSWTRFLQLNVKFISTALKHSQSLLLSHHPRYETLSESDKWKVIPAIIQGFYNLFWHQSPTECLSFIVFGFISSSWPPLISYQSPPQATAL